MGIVKHHLKAIEMMSDAQSHTTQRDSRFAREDVEREKEREAEKAEEERQRQRAAQLDEDERPAFIEGVARQTFADTNINSVAESINKQKHYVQRGTSAGAESFMRSG